MRKKISKIIFISISLICIAFILIFLSHTAVTVNRKNASQIKNLSNIKATSLDNLWCSTFQIAWENLRNKLNLSKIEFVNEENELVDSLNNTTFGLNSISDKDYYLFVDDYNNNVSDIITKDLKQKFNIKTNIFDVLRLEESNGKIIYSYLEKKYTFKNKFDTYNSASFITDNNNELKIKTFGIFESSDSSLIENIKNSYFIDEFNYGICLNTQENEEIILIMTVDIKENFEVLWQKYNENQKEYQHEFDEQDELRIPYINIDGFINYNDLCYKYIKNTDEYIQCAIQNVKFTLNEIGGKLENEVVIKTGAMSNRPSFYFYRPFAMFIKEKDKEEPYFAVRICDESFLQINN